jgi:HEAT repeat protein
MSLRAVCIALTLLAGAAAAQELPPVQPPPALEPAKVQALEREIDKLRNNNAEGRAKAEALVIEYGRGAIPYLVEQAHTTHAGHQAGLIACLLALADINDRELVAQSLTSPQVTLRRFAARKAGELGMPELLDKLPPLLKDADESVRTEAALALVSHGREEGLPVAALALGGPQRERARTAIRGVAGKGNHENIGAMLKIDAKREREEPDAASKERLAAVDVLYAIGDEPSIVLLVTALDDHHNLVQRSAINALRDLLEQQGPMAGSSIFQQIKEVERLKEVAKQPR